MANLIQFFTSHDWLGHASYNETLDQPINFKLDDFFSNSIHEKDYFTNLWNYGLGYQIISL